MEKNPQKEKIPPCWGGINKFRQIGWFGNDGFPNSTGRLYFFVFIGTGLITGTEYAKKRS
jgi:hypothetical protein